MFKRIVLQEMLNISYQTIKVMEQELSIKQQDLPDRNGQILTIQVLVIIKSLLILVFMETQSIIKHYQASKEQIDARYIQ